jgi:hypothetical protein
MRPSGCPKMQRTVVIGDDAHLIAQISSILVKKNSYLPILDGPRMQRNDADAEVVRRNNAAARVGPSAIIFAGLDDATCYKFNSHFPAKLCHRISNISDLQQAPQDLKMRSRPTLTWGKDRIGIGLLIALRKRQPIDITDRKSPEETAAFRSDHLVVCEDGHDLEQVIAANYAYAIGADLLLIPQVSKEDANRIRETFYSLDDSENSPILLRDQLCAELRERAAIPLKKYRLITFISQALPWGFAFSEMPTSHLFIKPDLGISIVNGIAAEQSNSPGIRIAAVIDPEKLGATEVESVAKCLARRLVFVRGFRGKMATVSNVGRMIELFPYDFLLIATHCGDAAGMRCTYEFNDNEGIKRELVIDEATSLSLEPGQDKVKVSQFEKFISIDGVDWEDEEEKEKLCIGSAINEFFARKNQLEPVKREPVNRVRSSAALQMNDHILIMAPHAIADNGCPVVLNNACTSWYRLAESFVFSNVRAYISTLFKVGNMEAQDVAMNLLDKYYGEPLAVALWRVQNEIYGDSSRRPYLFVGTHFQRLKVKEQGTPKYLLDRLLESKQVWSTHKDRADPSDEFNITSIDDTLRFLNAEIEGLRREFNKVHV